LTTGLQSDLDRKVRRLKWKGKRNYLFAYFLYAAAALASGIATIWTAALAASKTSPNLWLAVLASIPGVAVLLNETLKPELKGRWCYEKRAALEAMLRSLVYAGAPESEIVSRWNELELKMEREWPRFGAVVAKPTQVRNKQKP
jgi:hypothetical protein